MFFLLTLNLKLAGLPELLTLGLEPWASVLQYQAEGIPSASNRDKEALISLSMELWFNSDAKTLRVGAFQYRILCEFCLIVSSLLANTY